MLQELIPCIMCIIIARLWCLLLFVPTLLEQNLLHTHTMGMCFIFCVVVALGSVRYALRTRLSIQAITMLIGCATICYNVNKVALFNSSAVAQSELLPITIVLCSSITCFVVVYLTTTLLWNLVNHMWRVLSLVVGVIIGCIDISHWIKIMYYDLEHIYMVQGLIWVFIIAMIALEKILQYYHKRKEEQANGN